ncbi:hypothetical protein EMIT0P44_180035 [Pseudomonas sp. IT-P44]
MLQRAGSPRADPGPGACVHLQKRRIAWRTNSLRSPVESLSGPGPTTGSLRYLAPRIPPYPTFGCSKDMQVVSYRQMIRIHNQIDRSSSYQQSSFDSLNFTSIVQSRPVGRNPNPLVCTQGARPAHARDRWVPSVVFAQRPQGKQALLSLERCQAFTMNKEFHYVSSHGCTGFH